MRALSDSELAAYVDVAAKAAKTAARLSAATQALNVSLPPVGDVADFCHAIVNTMNLKPRVSKTDLGRFLAPP